MKCATSWCQREATIRKRCLSCYQYIYRTDADPEKARPTEDASGKRIWVPRPSRPETCSTSWCQKSVVHDGMCKSCYNFNHRTGIDPSLVDEPTIENGRRKWVRNGR